MPTELFELKVMVEADGWHEVAGLMDTVDRALDPHRDARDGVRRWSVVARQVPDDQTRELLGFIDECGSTAPGGVAPDDRLTA